MFERVLYRKQYQPHAKHDEAEAPIIDFVQVLSLREAALKCFDVGQRLLPCSAHV